MCYIIEDTKTACGVRMIPMTLNTYTHFEFEDAQAEVLLMDESCRKKSS